MSSSAIGNILFDNEISYMYKQVLVKNVPYRFLLIESGERNFESWIVVTLFEFMETKDNLLDAWSDFRKVKGEAGISALEFLAAWLLLFPDQQEMITTLNNKENPNEIRRFITLTKTEESLINGLLDRFSEEFDNDLLADKEIASEIIRGQTILDRIEPLESSSLQIKTASLQIDIPVELGNNVLPEYFDQAVKFMKSLNRY
jgi:hypothetical protein